MGGGKEISISILALASWESAVVPWWVMVGTAVPRGGRVYRMTAQTSSPVDFSKNSSHLALLALRMASRSSCLALLKPRRHPSSLRLFLRSALPRALRLSRISSFHHLLDLAQMVTRLVPWLRVSTRVAWSQWISAERSASELASSRVGLLGC